MELPVLIVGAGPTGLLLACQLAIHKIPFRIIDKNKDHTTQSRALVIQARSVEILDQMGIAEKAIRHGQIARAGNAYINGKRMVRIPFIDIGKGLTKFPHILMLEQSHTERILEEFLQAHEYHVERRTELIRLSQNEERVSSVIRSNERNEETIKSKYVVGADGAHSIVREQLKIPFGGKTYQQSLFVLDCKAEVDLPNDEMHLAFAGTSIGGLFPLTNGRWRILGTIPPEVAGKEEITFEDVATNFAQRVKMKVKLKDPHWISAYHSHHRYASTFQLGRCFLAGDAAHIHSPVGAQGMNTGLQDAYNLAWKLTLAMKGKAKATLLDTYTEERIIIARNLVDTIDKVFNFLTSPNSLIKMFRSYLLPPGMQLGGALFKHLKLVQQFAFTRVSELGVHYRESSLSKNASWGNFSSHAPHPGERLPFAEYIDGSDNVTNIQDRMTEKFFCLFIFNDKIPDDILSAILPYNEFISVETIPFSEKTKTLYKRFGIRKTGCYLVRPDMYIGYRDVNINAQELLRHLTQNYFDKV